MVSIIFWIIVPSGSHKITVSCTVGCTLSNVAIFVHFFFLLHDSWHIFVLRSAFFIMPRTEIRYMALQLVVMGDCPRFVIQLILSLSQRLRGACGCYCSDRMELNNATLRDFSTGQYDHAECSDRGDTEITSANSSHARV